METNFSESHLGLKKIKTIDIKMQVVAYVNKKYAYHEDTLISEVIEEMKDKLIKYIKKVSEEDLRYNMSYSIGHN